MALLTIAQANIKSMRMLCNELPFWKADAMPEIMKNQELNEAYAIGITGKVYALYFPNAGDIEVTLPNSKSASLQWLAIDESAWEARQKVNQ